MSKGIPKEFAEHAIKLMRLKLQEDEKHKTAFMKRYRADLERVQCAFYNDDVYMRRFTAYGEVYEIVEFMSGGATRCIMVVDYQRQKMYEYDSYLCAEVFIADQLAERRLQLANIAGNGGAD